MRIQPVFRTEKPEKSFFLAFEIDFDIVICNLKPLFIRQFAKNFHIGVQNSVQYNDVPSQRLFYVAVWKESILISPQNSNCRLRKPDDKTELNHLKDQWMTPEDLVKVDIWDKLFYVLSAWEIHIWPKVSVRKVIMQCMKMKTHTKACYPW